MKHHMLKCYQVIRADRAAVEVSVGQIVFNCKLPDYGTASGDTRHTGIPYTSMTKDKKGGYPFFTIPSEDLREVTIRETGYDILLERSLDKSVVIPLEYDATLLAMVVGTEPLLVAKSIIGDNEVIEAAKEDFIQKRFTTVL